LTPLLKHLGTILAQRPHLCSRLGKLSLEALCGYSSLYSWPFSELAPRPLKIINHSKFRHSSPLCLESFSLGILDRLALAGWTRTAHPSFTRASSDSITKLWPVVQNDAFWQALAGNPIEYSRTRNPPCEVSTPMADILACNRPRLSTCESLPRWPISYRQYTRFGSSPCLPGAASRQPSIAKVHALGSYS